MYLRHSELTIIRNSYNDSLINREPNYDMSRIIYNHYNYKKEELGIKKARFKISILEHWRLSRKADKQFMVCSDCMVNLLECRPELYKLKLQKFEESIYNLDIIGNDVRTPSDILFKNKRR